MIGEGSESTIERDRLRWQFLVVFLIAAGGNALLVFFGATWLPATWASLLMIGYGSFAYLKAPDVAKTDEFGDSFYYLGFILTLVALVVVLVTLGRYENPESTMEAVLPQFGLALCTTLLGLLGRTVFTMFQPETSSVQERAERKLAEAFDDFVVALERLTAEADAFQQRFSSELDNSLSQLRSSVVEFEDIVEDTSSEIRPLADTLTQTVQTLERGTERLDESLENLGARIEEAEESFGEQVVGAGRNVERSSEDVAQTLREVGGSAEALELALSEATSETQSLKNVKEEVDSFAEALNHARDAVRGLREITADESEEFADRLQSVTKSLSEVEQRYSTSTNSLAERHSELTDVVADWSKSLEELTKLRQALDGESESAAKALVEVRNELAAAVNFLRSDVGPDNPDKDGGN